MLCVSYTTVCITYIRGARHASAAVAVLDVAEGGVGKGRSCNWTLTSGFSFVLPRMSMQQSSFTLAGVGRICLAPVSNTKAFLFPFLLLCFRFFVK